MRQQTNWFTFSDNSCTAFPSHSTTLHALGNAREYSLIFVRSKCCLLTKKMMKMHWKARASWSLRERAGKFWERKFTKHSWKWNKSIIVTIAPFLWDNDYKSSYYLIMWLYSHSDFVACHLSWKKIYSISSENNGSTTIACD